jgi:putative PIN family toxin of toxin-antitoxin system
VRVVLDTNVIVSGLFFGGRPRGILDAWADGDLEVIITPSILEEYRRVCDRMREKYPTAEYQPVLMRLLALATMIPDPRWDVGVTEDPDDDKFMWCAWKSEALVVSGDRHLHAADGWRSVRVLTPGTFLASLGP